VSEIVEGAHETVHEHASHTNLWAHRVGVLISTLAATLAIAEIGENAA
jgi:hypothetical protein